MTSVKIISRNVGDWPDTKYFWAVPLIPPGVSRTRRWQEGRANAETGAKIALGRPGEACEVKVCFYFRVVSSPSRGIKGRPITGPSFAWSRWVLQLQLERYPP